MNRIRFSVALMLCASSLAFAQRVDTQSLIAHQLDEQVELSLSNVPLPDVLREIETKTGVPLRVNRETYLLLPWGELTPLNASVRQQTLRASLDRICGALGLQWQLEEQVISLRPLPALSRIGRRATVEELATLGTLYSTPAETMREATIEQHAQRIASLLEIAPLSTAGIRLDYRRPSEPEPSRSISLPPAATLGSLLDSLTQQSTLAWYPWGKTIVLQRKNAINDIMLDRFVTLRYEGVELTQVIDELSRKTGLTFSIEPGALQAVPAEYRSVRMVVDSRARQALETLCGITGLGYVVTDNGVYLWYGNAAPVSGGKPKVVATLPLSNGMQMLLTEDQIPPQLRAQMREELNAAIARLSTPPTTSPAGN